MWNDENSSGRGRCTGTRVWLWVLATFVVTCTPVHAGDDPIGRVVPQLKHPNEPSAESLLEAMLVARENRAAATSLRRSAAEVAHQLMTDPAVARSVLDTLGLQQHRQIPPLSQKEDESPWVGGPTAPAGCLARGRAATDRRVVDCQRCFARAHADLDKVRRKFDYVWRVYRSGMEYMNALIAMGEAARNTSMFARMATEKDAQALRQNVASIKTSYDRGYERLLVQLKTALDQVSTCENSAFGNDWYNRYGFVLYEAFAIRYKRTD